MAEVNMRVEKNQDIKKELVKTKRELSSEIKRETKKGHPILTCLIVLILAVVLVIGWTGSLVAKTGLVEVPVLTGIFYSVPEPVREVVPTQTFEEAMSDQLTELINERIYSIGGADIDRSLSLNLEEDVLTASLQVLLANQDKYFETPEIQLASVVPDQLELFMPLANNELDSALTVSLVPSIDQEGMLDLSIQSLHVGNLKLPNWIVGLVMNRPLDLMTWQLNKNMSQYATWESVQVHDKMLTLIGEINVNILEL
jgi:hypothetical protein